jgi:hypothetical protein
MLFWGLPAFGVPLRFGFADSHLWCELIPAPALRAWYCSLRSQPSASLAQLYLRLFFFHHNHYFL